MRWNPIWIKELKTRARVVRIPILLMLYNAVVALAALFMLMASMDIFNGGNHIDYSGMPGLFAGLGILQCSVGFLVTLVMTSHAITGEKEMGTMDLMLVSPISSGTVVGGKIMAAMTTSFLFAVSSLPILTVSTVYGGISGKNILYLCLVFLMITFQAASVGIMCSCIMDRSSLSIITSLIIESILLIGPFLFLEVINSFIYNKMQGALNPVFSLKGWVFVLLVNPTMLLLGFYDNVMGGDSLMNLFFYNYAIGDDTTLYYFLQKYFIDCCVLMQFLLSSFFLWIGMKKMGGRKKEKKKRREDSTEEKNMIK